jgi:inosose dehydratase
MKPPMVIKVANAPCSWGVLEFDLAGGKAPYERVLDEMAAAGYAGTELGDWGFMPTDPEALRAALEARKLAMLGAFVPVRFLDPASWADGAQRAVKTARLLKSVAQWPFIVLADENGAVPDRVRNAGRIRPGQGLTAAQWDTYAEGVEQVAARVFEDAQVQCVFHHHCAGWVETPEEIDALLSRTSPEKLGLCLDMGHYAFGGGDPLEALKRHAPRVWHVHFKDCDPVVAAKARERGWDYLESVKQGVFCELGQGAVNFAAITAQLRATGYDGWVVVEQDVLPGMGSPLESARRNRNFLKTLGL